MFDQYISSVEDRECLTDFIKHAHPTSHPPTGALLVFRGEAQTGKTTMFKALNEALNEKTNHLRRIQMLPEDDPSSFYPYPVMLMDGGLFGCEMHTKETFSFFPEDEWVRRLTIHILFDKPLKEKRRPIKTVIEELKEHIISLIE